MYAAIQGTLKYGVYRLKNVTQSYTYCFTAYCKRWLTSKQEYSMSITSLVIWLVLGAVAGWIAGIIMKTGSGSVVTNIIVGIIGAFLGGWIASLIGVGGATGGFSIVSVITAVVGACVLLFVLGLVQKRTFKSLAAKKV